MSPTWENTSPYDAPGGGGPQFMLPRMTYVTRLLLLGLGGIWLLSFLLYAPASGAYRSIEAWLGLDTGAWFQAPLYFPFWQLVTYGALHSPTGFGHVFYNLLVLYFFGTMLEERLGPRRFATFFVGAVLAGGIATTLLRTLGPFEDVLVVGASAGVLAVLVACAVETPNRTVILLFFPIPLKYLAGGLVLLDVLTTYASLFQPMVGDTDTLAHLGGVAFGFVMAKKRWMWNDLGETLQVKRQERVQLNEAADQERLDQLLARINREGIHSLTGAEKKFLNRTSERQRGSGR
jgi:membrane associated rhomboid family serine protease